MKKTKDIKNSKNDEIKLDSKETKLDNKIESSLLKQNEKEIKTTNKTVEKDETSNQNIDFDETDKKTTILEQKENKTQDIRSTNSLLDTNEDAKLEKNLNSNNVTSKKDESDKNTQQKIETKTVDTKNETVKINDKVVSNVNEEKLNASIKTEQQSQTVNTNETKVNSEVKNEKVANELASLSSKTEQKVDIKKDQLDSNIQNDKTKENKSLLDKLIEDNKDIKAKEDKSQVETTKQNPNAITSAKGNEESKDLLTSMYLSSQKQNMNNQSLANKAEAVNQVKDAKSTKDVKEGASKLDIEVKNIEVEIEKAEVKSSENSHLNKKSFLDRLAFNNNVRYEDNRNIVTKSVEASKAILADDTAVSAAKEQTPEVNVNVNPALAQNIQSRIIGAKQQMSTMMSDVARQMYENYKPPVTAFRINLHPATLGAISIVMKSDKDNAINISMNISNNSTLDAFVDSQNGLKSALNKNFGEQTEFNLDFNSNEGGSNQSSSNGEGSSNQSFGSNTNTQTILEQRENNQVTEDKNTEYM